MNPCDSVVDILLRGQRGPEGQTPVSQPRNSDSRNCIGEFAVVMNQSPLYFYLLLGITHLSLKSRHFHCNKQVDGQQRNGDHVQVRLESKVCPILERHSRQNYGDCLGGVATESSDGITFDGQMIGGRA